MIHARTSLKSACPRSRTAYRLDEFPVFEQLGLVLDVIARDPCLDLIPQPLQLLNLCLEVCLELLLLRLVCRRLHLVVDALEELDALRDLLECPVDFRCEPPCIEHTVTSKASAATHFVAFWPPC